GVAAAVAAEAVVARAAEEGVDAGRAVERQNAGDGLARQAVGAGRGGVDAERSPAAIQALDCVEVRELRSVQGDSSYTAGEIELLHVGDGEERRGADCVVGPQPRGGARVALHAFTRRGTIAIVAEDGSSERSGA